MCENDKKKIVLPDELQKEMLKFFMKTSIPRITRKRRETEKEKALSNETKGQELK